MARVHCSALSKMNNVKLVCAVDLDPKRAESFKANYGFSRTSTDYIPELEKKDFDIVLCCTHWQMRFEILKNCIKAGKHILAEKPISVYMDEVVEILKMAKKRKIKLRVGFMERFRPMFLKTEKLLLAGAIGRPLVFSFIHHQSSGGSGLEQTWKYYKNLLHGGLTPNVDCGIHKCDLARWLGRTEPEQVFSTGCRLEADSPGNNFSHSAFRMKNNVSFIMEDCFSKNTRPFVEMNIYGDKGKMKLEYAGKHDRPFFASEEDIIRIWSSTKAAHEELYLPAATKAVGPQMAAFMDEIENDKDMEWHYTNVMKATEMALGTLLSEKRMAAVRFPLNAADYKDLIKYITK